MATMSVHIKNGTPLHGESKCQTCVNALIRRGYRESEEEVVCQASYPDRRVPFPVRECSAYIETKRQSLEQMEKIAWMLAPRSGKRPAGFVTGSEVRKDEDEIELILDQEK
jgi:hypothetical protein